jgi:sugar lactone lactonase YvrE
VSAPEALTGEPAAAADWQALPVPPSLLGESPFWHPDEAALYWCDIPGKALHRWDPARQAHRQWALPAEPGSCAPLPGGDLLLALRDGLFRFVTASGERRRLVAAPYDTVRQRCNDGKADPQGRFWVGTLDDARQPDAALYRWANGRLERMVRGITVSNGLAHSPDGRTMYWSDTAAHRIACFDFDGSDGSLSRQRVFAQFEPKPADGDLTGYGGRPDGAAVDTEGAYWCAMYEGQRLVRLSPEGQLLQAWPLPVRCPTMPCFGGPDLRTLYVTTARHGRPDAELAAQPLAGCVLTLRVAVPGLPVNFARG